jgi:hypothetical protein
MAYACPMDSESNSRYGFFEAVAKLPPDGFAIVNAKMLIF